MFSKYWKTSERKYTVIPERHVKIKMSDSIEIDADIFHPDAPLEKFPAILGMHPYNNEWQSDPLIPGTIGGPRGHAEAGDPWFFVRRGYVQIVANVRGTGGSGGHFGFLDKREAQDVAEVIEWISRQSWCDGNVGMFGSSYFTWSQYHAAALNPPNLKCIFAAFGATDMYRHVFYHGGILAHLFLSRWTSGIDAPRYMSVTKKRLGEQEFLKHVEEISQDVDIMAVPSLANAVRHPGEGVNSMIMDVLLNKFDSQYYQERDPMLDQIRVPAYLGADWGMFGLHTPGAFTSWECIKSFKKLVMGPPLYYDRPQYQPMYEALRWFDHWMKGMKTGIEDEPDVRLFMPGTNDWKYSVEWPLPETKWTPFFLHSRSLLSEHEFWPNEGYTTYEDSIFNRGELKWSSPAMVENTEIVGPIMLELYGSTTRRDVLWFVTLLEIDSKGDEKKLTRGWLRGSQKDVDRTKSKPYEVFHPHKVSEELVPDIVYKFEINLIPTANVFKAGSKIGLLIKSADNEQPKNYLERVGSGHIWSQTNSRVTVYHCADYPSCLYLPITSGNIQGTYISGGVVAGSSLKTYRHSEYDS